MSLRASKSGLINGVIFLDSVNIDRGNELRGKLGFLVCDEITDIVIGKSFFLAFSFYEYIGIAPNTPTVIRALTLLWVYFPGSVSTHLKPKFRERFSTGTSQKNV